MQTLKDFIDSSRVTDLHLYNNGNGAHVFKSNAGAAAPAIHATMSVLPEPLKDKAQEIFRLCTQEPQDDFSLRFDFLILRCRRIKSINGVEYFIRIFHDLPWSVGQLGLPQVIQRAALSDKLTQGGLIIICGRPGQGKSTTAASLMVKRLELYGGLCITIEDPAEVSLNGPHGDAGYCIQTEIDNDDHYAKSIRCAMRSYPAHSNSLMYVGEIRDGAAAGHVLKSALDGRLVIATVHAGGVVAGLQRVLSLATSRTGGGAMSEDAAKDLLASGFKMVIHQEIIAGKLKATALVSNNAIQNNIRKGSFALLSTEVTRQNNAIITGQSLE